MLEGKVIFILSLMKFDGLPSTNFTMAKYLAKANDVYYMEHPMTYKDYYKIDKSSPAFLRRKKAIKRGSNGLLDDKIEGVNILMSPLIYPVNGLPAGKIYQFINRKNEEIVANRIKQIVFQKQIKKYIFINLYDYNLPMVAKHLDAVLNIYYCVDPVPDYDRKHGIENEKLLIKHSHLIICTSKALFEEKKQLNHNTYFVPNGSDLVNTVDELTLRVSKKLESIPKPTVGYIGAIERRLDYKLLQSVVSSAGDINFVFVGPVHEGYVPKWFFQQKNVFFLPPVQYDEVAALIKGFDVCIIPFKRDDISKTIFPLKLFEYLGLGKPVVSVDFNPDLRDYTGNLVDYASNATVFVQSIRTFLHDTDDEKKQQRINLAKKNTWSARVATFSEIVLKHLNITQA